MQKIDLIIFSERAKKSSNTGKCKTCWSEFYQSTQIVVHSCVPVTVLSLGVLFARANACVGYTHGVVIQTSCLQTLTLPAR